MILRSQKTTAVALAVAAAVGAVAVAVALHVAVAAAAAAAAVVVVVVVGLKNEPEVLHHDVRQARQEDLQGDRPPATGFRYFGFPGFRGFRGEAVGLKEILQELAVATAEFSGYELPG